MRFLLPVFHDQIEREVLDEELAVVTNGLTVQGVKDSMAGTICYGAAASCLTTLKIKHE